MSEGHDGGDVLQAGPWPAAAADHGRMTLSLLSHYASVLGPPVASAQWEGHPDRGFEVLSFGCEPALGGITCATSGMSGHRLDSSIPGEVMRQELMMTVSTEADLDVAANLVAQVGREVLESHHGALRGTVIGPRGPLFDGSAMEALYVSAPAYLPEGFETYRDAAGDVFIAWLVPISHAEAHFVLREGWSAFEDALVDRDVVLTDVRRPGLVLHR